MEREIVFGAFDCPDAGQSAPSRKQSTTPIQALNLFNSRFSAAESHALADRLRHEKGQDPTGQIQHLWHLAYSRPPEPDVLIEARDLVESHGLETLCRAVL